MPRITFAIPLLRDPAGFVPPVPAGPPRATDVPPPIAAGPPTVTDRTA